MKSWKKRPKINEAGSPPLFVTVILAKGAALYHSAFSSQGKIEPLDQLPHLTAIVVILENAQLAAIALARETVD